MTDQTADAALKDRHRSMWAAGNYGEMVQTFLLPLGETLVGVCGLGPGTSVLDVAAGTGNAAIAAARTGASVTASDLTPELLDAGRMRAESEGLTLDWIRADAEHLPFEDATFDVVMSSIGVMFAPDHQQVADELVRVCRPSGRIALLSWTPDGMVGALFRTMAPFAPAAPPGAQPAPLWGTVEHLHKLFSDRVHFDTLREESLEVTAFQKPEDFAEHFGTLYGPAIAVRTNARANGLGDEFAAALRRFCENHNRGTPSEARFEMGYLLATGTLS